MYSKEYNFILYYGTRLTYILMYDTLLWISSITTKWEESSYQAF